MKDLLAYMIGPKAENMQLFRDLIVEALDDHMFWRRNFYPQDLPVVKAFDQSHKEYRDFVDTLRDRLFEFLSEAKRGIPFFSPRYIGHMNTDLLLPGLLGYFGAMLYNQNNVAGESSPVTARLEAEVIEKMCHMVGYSPDTAFGYLSSGGTTANFYALWMARNLKTMPLSLRLSVADRTRDGMILKELSVALKDVESTGRKRRHPDESLLDSARVAVGTALRVVKADGSEALLSELNAWELLNIPIEASCGLRRAAIQSIARALGGKDQAAALGLAGTLFDLLIKPWSLATLGEVGFRQQSSRHFPAEKGLLAGPWRVYVARNKHYSWPKAMDILGIGREGLVEIPHRPGFDMDIAALHDRLTADADEARRGGGLPLLVVSLFGTTEEGALDDLPTVAATLGHLQRGNGLSPWWHVDAAYGGYLGTLLPDELRSALAGPRGDAVELERVFAAWATDGVVTFKDWLEKCCVASGLDLKANRRLIHDLIEISERGEGSWLSWRDLLRRTACLREAHSITIDPHKLGYIPYPSGAVLVKHREGREVVSHRAPYLWSGARVEAEFSGQFTVEGSRAGATAAACWLAHTVAPLDPNGHGRLIALSILATRYLYLQLKKHPPGCDSSELVIAVHQPHTNVLCYVPFHNEIHSLERCRSLTSAVLDSLKPVNETRPFMTVGTEVAVTADSPAFEPFDPTNSFAGLLRGQVGDIEIPVIRSVVMGPYGLVATTREEARGPAKPLYEAFAEHLRHLIGEAVVTLNTQALQARITKWTRPASIIVMDNDPSIDHLLRDVLSLHDARLTRDWRFFEREADAMAAVKEGKTPIDIAFLDIDMEGSSEDQKGHEDGGYRVYEAILKRNIKAEDDRFRVKLVVFFTKGYEGHEMRLERARENQPNGAVPTHTLDKEELSQRLKQARAAGRADTFDRTAQDTRRLIWEIAQIDIDDESEDI